jgi:uncharacterized protein (TIGR02217 family)
MGVSLDSIGSGHAAVAANTLSFNHTCAGTNRSLVVSIMYADFHTGTITGVSYDGIPMILVAPGSPTAFSALNMEMVQYILVTPPVGTFSVQISAAYPVEMQAISASFNGTSGLYDSTNNDAEFGNSYNSSSGSEQYASATINDLIITYTAFNASGSLTPGTSTAIIGTEAIGSSFGSNLCIINMSGSFVGGANATGIPGSGWLYQGFILRGGTQTLAPFHEIRMDPRIVYGSTTSLQYSTAIVPVPSGDEYRKQFWQEGRRKFTISKQLLALASSDPNIELVPALFTFIRGRRGRAFGFRLRDWTFYRLNSVPLPLIADGTGKNAQLQYTFADPINPETVYITKPVLDTDVNNDSTQPAWKYAPDITLTQDGVAFPSSGNWTLDRTTGLINFAADQRPHTLLWSGSFDTPVRLDSDSSDFKREDLNIMNWNDIVMVELKFTSIG